jgi:hypothetical protein
VTVKECKRVFLLRIPLEMKVAKSTYEILSDESMVEGVEFDSYK